MAYTCMNEHMMTTWIRSFFASVYAECFKMQMWSVDWRSEMTGHRIHPFHWKPFRVLQFHSCLHTDIPHQGRNVDYAAYKLPWLFAFTVHAEHAEPVWWNACVWLFTAIQRNNLMCFGFGWLEHWLCSPFASNFFFFIILETQSAVLDGHMWMCNRRAVAGLMKTSQTPLHHASILLHTGSDTLTPSHLYHKLRRWKIGGAI